MNRLSGRNSPLIWNSLTLPPKTSRPRLKSVTPTPWNFTSIVCWPRSLFGLRRFLFLLLASSPYFFTRLSSSLLIIAIEMNLHNYVPYNITYVICYTMITSVPYCFFLGGFYPSCLPSLVFTLGEGICCEGINFAADYNP